MDVIGICTMMFSPGTLSCLGDADTEQKGLPASSSKGWGQGCSSVRNRRRALLPKIDVVPSPAKLVRRVRRSCEEGGVLRWRLKEAQMLGRQLLGSWSQR